MSNKILINTCIVFWALFGLKFNAFLDTSALFLIPALIYFRFTFETKFLFYLLIIYTIHVFILASTTQILDTWHLFQPLKSLLVVLGIYGILQKRNIKNVNNLIVNAILIHSIIVILFYVFPVLQNSLNEITGFNSKSVLRVNGFSHSYGTTSLMHIIALPFILNDKKNFKALRIVIILISTIFLARVGLYLGILFLIAYSLKDLNIKKILIITLLFTASIFAVDFIVSTDYKTIDSEYQIMFLTFKWAFESLISLVQDGNFENNSFNTLNIEYLNSSFLEFIFGTGDFGRNEVHLKTDISYLLYFSYVGLVGLFVLVLIHTRILFTRNMGYLLLSFVLLITAFKEATFLTRGIFPLYILLLYEKEYAKSSISPR